MHIPTRSLLTKLFYDSSLLSGPQGKNLRSFDDASRRNFWGYLNVIFNRYDQSRVKEVGGDRACAEWLLRNGAAIKYESSAEWIKDYNILPPINVRPKIVEVDASESSISHAGGGFKHFEHTKHIRRLKLHRCNYMYDAALYQLPVLSFSLRDLEVSGCPNVSDDGILALSNIVELEKLYMYDLLGVKDRKKCIEVLQKSLTKCQINFPWAQESEQVKAEEKKE